MLQESNLNMKKNLTKILEIEKKNLTMVFELMVNLCIEICYNFGIFNIAMSSTVLLISF